MTEKVYIAIDAGHGYGNRQVGVYDPGTVAQHQGRVYQEASIALQYALTLRWALIQAGHKVFLTRASGEEDAPLSRRVPRAREAGCEAFLSIHLNSNARPGTLGTGIETLYRTESQRAWARLIHEATLRAFPQLPNRGLKVRTKLAVLAFEPHACLLELGFINNPIDIELIAPTDKEKYRQTRIRWAQQIATALEEFKP